ncbi:Histone acetyltransferase type B catalytic subunit [Papilio machaon]|uniref:histone acetyltransferase n=1 Tax=Papilio machaon TaxID=76193 RepID=A0A194R4K0_PAPMA|nr:Histone acetyltransferase type B catalytic subunit [Papilio machaon]
MTDALNHLVVDGNEVLELKLVRTVKDIEDDEASFGPEMCHQVFGENENIFGYTDLNIKLYYSAGSLQTYLGIDYTNKIEPSKSDGMKADDVEGALRKVLAPGYVTNLDRFISLLGKDRNFVPHGQLEHAFPLESLLAPGYVTNLDRFISLLGKDRNFVPHGQLEHAFPLESRDGGDKRLFEVYYSETSTPGFLAYHQRLQTFLLWYVDAASFIDVDDDQWTFFTVFEKYWTSDGEVRYATAGYATVYRYYAYPRHTRPRVSQSVYSHFISQPEVVDITVEDPSPEFQRIRDYVDAKNCESLSAFQPAKLLQGYVIHYFSSFDEKDL